MLKTNEEYGWGSTLPPESCEYVAPKVIRILHRLEVSRVCDIGAGNGALAAVLQEEGFYVVGVEPDKHGLELSRQKCPQIHFYNLGVEDDPSEILSLEGIVFDAVVSTEVIEHLYSPHLLLQFARRLLRDGGYLVLSTPYHGYLKNLALSIFGKWDYHHTPLREGGHIKFWSRRTLTQLLEENGFRVIDFYGAGRLPWMWKSMIMVAEVAGNLSQ